MRFYFRLLPVLSLLVAGISSCSSSSNAPPLEESQGTFIPNTAPSGLEKGNNTPGPAPATGDPIEDARRTLASLAKVDDFPLYTMTYYSDYSPGRDAPAQSAKVPASHPAWGCSLFAALGDPGSSLYGRNFDWDYSPALLLFTHPPDGYASVSMVDLAYLVDVRDYNRLDQLPLEQRQALLETPLMPFDGTNAAGVAIGMAAVPASNGAHNPGKETIDSILIIREVLDHAGNVDEAAAIFQKYNIDWGSAPVMHYMIADRSGQAILIEYSGEGMALIRNRDPWLLATNFLVDQAGENPDERCWRYERISHRLAEEQGRLAVPESMNLLSEVSQDNPSGSTQWSVVYGLDTGEVHVVVGQQYDKVYTFSLADNR